MIVHREPYMLSRAALLALCCHAVMLDPPSMRAVVQRVHGTLLGFFNHENGTQAAMFIFPWGSVLAFRATEVRLDRPLESLKDIWTDLRFRKAPFRGARVHRGFLAAYEAVRPDLVETLSNMSSGPFFITGHSLGGALAKLAAMEIDTNRISAVYTYGAPRVGNADVDELIGAPLYQFIHAADIVPRVPLLALGYRGSGDKRYITAKGRIIRSPSALRTAGRFVWTAATSPIRLVTDHALLDGYLGPIEAGLRKKS